MLLPDPLFTKYKNIHEALMPRLDKLPSPPCASEYAVSHMEAARSTKYLDLKGNATGHAFELIVLNALIHAGVSQHLFLGTVNNTRYNADIDMLIAHRPHAQAAIGLLMKTSLRERWKQADRDAMIFTHNGDGPWHEAQHELGIYDHSGEPMDRSALRPWLLTFRENEKATAQNTISFMRKNARRYYGIPAGQAITVYDKEQMASLVAQCKALS